MSRVLIVDDSDLSRRMIGDTLRRAGHEVLEAADGPAALQTIQPGELDLVITDFMMPGMLGDELVKKIRATDESLPIVVISSYTDSDLFKSMKAQQVARVLNKPFADNDVLDAVRECARTA
ncbi:MAG: response regulator [Planctomycetota bacterium]|jgi:two-component system chemotaxis response regulator CheY